MLLSGSGLRYSGKWQAASSEKLEEFIEMFGATAMFVRTFWSV